jgi:hypothetical protein
MPCLAAVLALFFPRIVLVLLFLFTTYLQRAFDYWLWPLLGFIFMPLTTVVYAWAINVNGSIAGPYLIAIIVAVLFDFGLLGGAARSRRRD